MVRYLKKNMIEHRWCDMRTFMINIKRKNNTLKGITLIVKCFWKRNCIEVEILQSLRFAYDFCFGFENQSEIRPSTMTVLSGRLMLMKDRALPLTSIAWPAVFLSWFRGLDTHMHSDASELSCTYR